MGGGSAGAGAAGLWVVSCTRLPGGGRAAVASRPAQVGETGQLLDADVLALQEADRYQPRSGYQPQAAAIAAEMGATAWRFEETVAGVPGQPGWAPGRGLVPDGDRAPGFGVALLSRIPVRRWHVLRLSPGRGRLPVMIPSRPPRVLWLRDEPRAVVAAELESPRLTVACVHLSFMPARSIRQLGQVRHWLAQLPGPRLLMGDLNLPAGLVSRRMPGWAPLVSLATWPAPRPRLQLDHILQQGLPDGAQPWPRQAQAVRMPISDHCALGTELLLS